MCFNFVFWEAGGRLGTSGLRPWGGLQGLPKNERLRGTGFERDVRRSLNTPIDVVFAPNCSIHPIAS